MKKRSLLLIPLALIGAIGGCSSSEAAEKPSDGVTEAAPMLADGSADVEVASDVVALDAVNEVATGQVSAEAPAANEEGTGDADRG